MSDEQLPSSTMAISLDQFNMMRNDFTKHYYLADCNPNFGGQEVQVSWHSFSLAVHNFMKEYRALPHTVAIRFVHCYNPQANVLYLRMQILTMAPVQDVPGTNMLLDGDCSWYELSNGIITPTENTDLFDAQYLNYFYYCNAEICSPSSLTNLATDTDALLYARTVTMPWFMELLQLYIENGMPQNATLCIDAGSMLSDNSKIAYQHTVMAYLRDQDGTPMLDNTIYLLPFQNKAADCGTICPSQCNVYVIPTQANENY